MESKCRLCGEASDFMLCDKCRRLEHDRLSEERKRLAEERIKEDDEYITVFDWRYR